MSYSICQRCGEYWRHHWTIRQAELHVGAIEYWKLQLCEICTKHVEQAVLAALRPAPVPSLETKPQ